MLNVKAILTALSGVLIVGSIGTYVVLENRKSQDAPVEVSAPAASNEAVKEESVAAATDDASTQTQTEEVATATEQEPAASEEAASPTADWVMPAFDLLRVEPDGSTVIAGRGQPNTSLKIMNGEEMIAETDVGPSGDFVVIFDEALNSGDYQLSLKVEDENGTSLTSEETAIVSVPEDASGQLLAMVQKPGEASRIITQPETAPVEEAVTTAESATEEKPTATAEVTENTTTATEEVVEKAADVAESAQAAAGETATVVENATESAVETVTKIAEAATEAKSAVEEKAAEIASNVTNDETVKAATSEAETIVAEAKDAVETVMEKATEEVADAADKVMEKTEEAMETAKAAVEETAEKAVEGTENVVAALTSENSEASDTQSDSQAAATNEQPLEEKMETKTAELVTEKPAVEEKPKAPSQNVRIEAVEVEGSKLFVAGSGTAGYQVRVFADDEEVGLANIESNGRFIVEATKDLDVGQHKITAALEDKQTNQVILRAIVPFNRPEGQALAAVASSDTAETDEKPVEDKSTETAMVKEEPKAADTNSATETASASNTDTQAATSETSSDAASSETMTKEEEMVKSEEAEVTSTAATDTSTSTDTSSSATEQAEGTASATEEETAVAAANDNQASEPKTIVQDQLQPASSQSVIIRRGDTLWQIARRTYGAGVRYTTIYLANQQQIENPDKIAPGQIFEVPEEALENAEQLHRQRLGLE